MPKKQKFYQKSFTLYDLPSHPSDDPEPSEDDLEITKRITEVGKLIGINILDHIIITKTKFFSFKDKKLI